MTELGQLKKDLFEAKIQIARLNDLVIVLWSLAAKDHPGFNELYKSIYQKTLDESVAKLEKDYPDANFYVFPPERPKA